MSKLTELLQSDQQARREMSEIGHNVARICLQGDLEAGFSEAIAADSEQLPANLAQGALYEIQSRRMKS